MSNRYSPSFLEDIRNRVPISSIIGRSVQWDRKKTKVAKGDFWACCPFHGEKSASFHCEDRKGRYHCFGCGVSGDVFRWMTDRQGMSFGEAVEALAGEAGLPVPQASADAIRRETRRRSLAEIVEAAARFFEDRLWGDGGKAARDYLAQRGLNPELAKRFRLGFAPDDRSALKQFLGKLGVSNEDMAEAGLIKVGEDIPVPYDRFRNRLVFPVIGDKDQVLGFSGRLLSGEGPKYLNSPATPLFDKGRLLYNGPGARKAAWDAEATVVAMEGNIDVITAVGAGFEGACAPMGTALTEEQLLLLWRMAARPIFCFDGDDAGQKAMERAIDVALPLIQPGRSILLARCPKGIDPDDLIRKRGPEAFRMLLAGPQTLAEAIWQAEAGKGLSGPDAVAAASQRLTERVAVIKHPVARKAYADDMAARLRAFRSPRKLLRSNGHSNHSISPSSIRLSHGYHRAPMMLREALMVAAIAGAPDEALDRSDSLAGEAVDRLIVALSSGDVSRCADDIAEARAICAAAGLADVAAGDPEACASMLRGE